MENGAGEIHSPAARGRELGRSGGYRIGPGDQLGAGSLREKCRANFRAIEVLRAVEAEGRDATPEEQQTLVRYVGWGGLPHVFATHEDKGWKEERARLRELLAPEEYRSAQATILDRLLHHADILAITGRSYRLQQSARTRNGNPTTDKPVTEKNAA